MLLGGDVSPSLLEDVLADLATRGGIRAVEGADGEDLLTPAVEAALAIVRGVTPRSQSRLPPNASPSVPAFAASVGGARADARTETPSPAPAYETLKLSEPPPPPAAEDDADAPSSLEDAVMREISERSPYPGPARASAPELPPIVEPSELRPRSSNPPADPGAAAADDDPRLLPSIPPDAIVPETVAADAAAPEEARMEAAAPAPASELATPAPAKERTLDPAPSSGESASRDEGPFVSPFDAAVPAAGAALAPSATVDSKASAPKVAAPEAIESVARTEPAVIAVPVPAASERPPSIAPRKKASFPWGLVAAFLVLAGAVVAAIHFAGTEADSLTAPPPSALPANAPPPTVATANAPPANAPPPTIATANAPPANAPPASAPTASTPTASPPRTSVATASAVTTVVATASAPTASIAPATRPTPPPADGLPPGIEVPPGSGYLEVTAPPGANVRVDGALIGTGPTVSRVVAAGYHEVAVEQGGHETPQVIEVRDGKTTRVRSAAGP